MRISIHLLNLGRCQQKDGALCNTCCLKNWRLRFLQGKGGPFRLFQPRVVKRTNGVLEAPLAPPRCAAPRPCCSALPPFPAPTACIPPYYFCFTCCSSLWEETGLQLVRIPAAAVTVVTGGRGAAGSAASLIVVGGLGGRRARPVLRRGGATEKSAQPCKEWQPLEAGQETVVPFFSKASCRYSSVKVCVHTEQSSGNCSMAEPLHTERGLATEQRAGTLTSKTAKLCVVPIGLRL